MYHYFEAITNTSGDSLIGYYARVIDRVTQQAVDIYADESGTPIDSISGFPNLAVTDQFGNLDFYLEPGTYNLDIYAPDATTFRFRVPNVGMTSTQGEQGAIGPAGAAANNFSTVANIQALNPSQFPTAVLAADAGSDSGYINGLFTYQLGNYDGRADVIQVTGIPLSTGAYVRQVADSVYYAFNSDSTVRPTKERLSGELYLEDKLPSGFVKTGGVDYTTAIQAAMNDAVAARVPLIIPDGIFDVTGEGVLAPSGLKIRANGRDRAIIRNLNGPVLRLNGSEYDFEDVFFFSVAGGESVKQTGPVSRSAFRRIALWAAGVNYSIWDNMGYPLIKVDFVDSYFQQSQAATKPGFNLSATGGIINNNHWRDCWVQESGNYWCRLATTDSNSQYGNVFDGIVFEVCSGGGIQLVGCKGFVLNDLYNWDVEDGTPNKVKKDFFDIAISGSGATSLGKISNIQRLASTLDTGIVDIRLPTAGGGSGITIDNVSTVAGGDPFLVDARGNFIWAVAPDAVVTISNSQNATVVNPLTGEMTLPGGYKVGGVRVVGPRVTGFGAMVGTADKAAISTYDVVLISNPPTQAEVQALSGKMQEVTRRLKAIDDALRAHGLMGT